MGEDRKAAIKRIRLLSPFMKGDIDAFRAKIESEYDEGILPNKVEYQRRNLGGVVCDILSPELYTKGRVIFYIHGGSFAGGSAQSYRGFCARLAHKTLCRVAIPDFRLAPDHAFPTSIKDAQNAFCALLAEEQVSLSLDDSAKGRMPQIILAADGSGSSIAISLITTLKDKYKNSIYAVIFLSPWLDISDESIVLSGKSVRDEVLTSEGIKRAAEMYADRGSRASSLCSLPYCTEEMLSAFPSVFIQMGEREILLEDAKRAQKMLTDAGAECTLDVWQGMMHLFQMSDDKVDECHLAIDRIGGFVRRDKGGGEETDGAFKERGGEKRYFNQPPLEAGI